MATTDTRPGFRLPWSTDHRAPDEETASQAAETVEAATAPTETPDTPVMHEPQAVDDAPAVEPAAPEPETTTSAMSETLAATTAPIASTAAAKRPTKFLADLTRAMRTAAEAERAEILERFQAETKLYVEQIHERSGGETTDIRKHADDDIAGIRDWSKAEIARIREETDERIAHRKSRLDKEIEEHAARIEREIEKVTASVGGFEAAMDHFFENLLTEEDPTHFAELAGNLPEPPSLEDITAAAYEAPPRTVVVVLPEPVVEAPPVQAVPETVVDVVPEPVAETVAETVDTADEADVDAETDSGHAEGEVEIHADAAATETDAATDGDADDQSADAPVDPRVAALGLTPDFAAAEAEAFAGVDGEHADDGGGEEIVALDDETIAARLAGLPQLADEAPADTHSTQVVVTGLVSVASIAGFKRHLTRLPGVRSVGVSSGPDGEFLFTVTHGEEVVLTETIPQLPGFAARITDTGDGVLHVSAHDPETDA